MARKSAAASITSFATLSASLESAAPSKTSAVTVEPEGKLIGTLFADGSDPVVVSIRSWKGRSGLDVRQYWRDMKAPEGEQYKPGKGLRVPASMVPKFLDLLVDHAQEITDSVA